MSCDRRTRLHPPSTPHPTRKAGHPLPQGEREGGRSMTFPTVTAALDRRLGANASAPLAVGFSGGGDSLALLILTLDWARAHGRSVLALTVDHRLNPASAAW